MEIKMRRSWRERDRERKGGGSYSILGIDLCSLGDEELNNINMSCLTSEMQGRLLL
jgi:hypothetical protein